MYAKKKIIKNIVKKWFKVFLSYYYYSFFINFLKIIWKPFKNHIKNLFNFFLIIIRMEQLRQQNALDTLLDLEKRKELKNIKREDDIIKDVKNLFRLRNEIEHLKILEIFLNFIKEIKQQKTEWLGILGIILSRKKKIIISQ